MPKLLVIRMHPSEAISAEDFEEYLEGFSFHAHDLSFGGLAGTGAAFGTASYSAPVLSPSQIMKTENQGVRALESSGTAILQALASRFSPTPPATNL